LDFPVPNFDHSSSPMIIFRTVECSFLQPEYQMDHADHQDNIYAHPKLKIDEEELRLRLSKSKVVYQVENFNQSESIFFF
jgi:hypothetical protein